MLSILFIIGAWVMMTTAISTASIRYYSGVDRKINRYKDYVADKQKAQKQRVDRMAAARQEALQSQGVRTMWDPTADLATVSMPAKRVKKKKQEVEKVIQKVTPKNLPLSDSAFYDEPRQD